VILMGGAKALTSCYVLLSRQAGVRIIAAAIDDSVDPQTHAVHPGIGDFVSRYNDENVQM
jgi:uracil phosphoribosyltransferase